MRLAREGSGDPWECRSKHDEISARPRGFCPTVGHKIRFDNKERTKMKRIATLLILIGISVLGCHASTGPSADDRLGVGNCDYLVGWFKMMGRDTMIPVFKIDETYYSVCRGFEIPLKECPEGLEWALTPSSMVGTTIGFDEASSTHYIAVMDSQLSNFSDGRGGTGEKQSITKIDKPSGLLDATAERPRTNDDFLGWYQPVWPPWFRFEVREDGEKHLVAMPGLDGKTEEEPRELTPLPDRLGFTGFDRRNRHSLTYNEALKRFELTKTSSCVIRMPLARVPPPPSPDGREAPTVTDIGIPSWH